MEAGEMLLRRLRNDGLTTLTTINGVAFYYDPFFVGIVRVDAGKVTVVGLENLGSGTYIGEV